MAKQRYRLTDRKSKVTVSDVARLAEVSDSTVSRIMRGQGLVADATREKVMATVRALGYVPNRIAGSLASLDSRLVGVVIPSLSNIVFPEILQGINAGLLGTNRQSVISVTDYDLDKEEEVVRNLLAWQPAAVLIAGSVHTDATQKMLENSGVRVIEFMEIDHPPIDTAVGLSHVAAGKAAARHLMQRGYRRFGYVGYGGTQDLRARMRYRGLCEGLAEAGLAFVAECVSDGQTTVAKGKAQTAEICARLQDLDVLTFSSDDMAVGGLFHCLGAGIRVPKDLGLFGFNGLDIGRALPQPLSTVRTNRFEIGKRAIEEFLANPTRPLQPQIIDTGFEIFEGATA
ncbi:MAG: LacI family DNA-binding transcriptional regulator [Cypionkella sp.]|jgi:LacI family transcriptional regulator, gluconate utilization system Gnt-I transcriptional repressor